MVVSGQEDAGEIESIIGGKQPGMLYRNLPALIGEFQEFLDKQLAFLERFFEDNKRRWIEYFLGPHEDIPFEEWSLYPALELVKDWKLFNGFASLLYANNNYWGNQINIGIEKDLGKKIHYAKLLRDSEAGEEMYGLIFKLESDLSTGEYPKVFTPQVYEGPFISPNYFSADFNVPDVVALAFIDSMKLVKLQSENG